MVDDGELNVVNKRIAYNMKLFVFIYYSNIINILLEKYGGWKNVVRIRVDKE